MKVDRRQFVEVLEKVAPALGTNVLMPEFQYFQIAGDHIQTTDGVVIVDTTFSKDTGLNCSIPRDVLRLLTSLDAKEVDLVVKNDKLEIKTNKLEGEFAILTPPKFQELKLGEEDVELTDSKLVDDIIEGLGFCRFAASKDHAAGPRTGVQVNKDTLFSTDRFRVLKWDLVGDTHIICTVPIKFIDLLKKHQSRVVMLRCVKNKTFIAFLNDHTYISTTLIAGQYPEVLAYFPDLSWKCEHVEFGNSLAMAIERHLSLLKDVDACDREILVEVKEGICTLTSSAPERSNLVEQVDVEMAGTEEVNFSVNPIFLQGITNRCSSFEYFPAVESALILFKTEKLQYVMRANMVSSKKDSSEVVN